MKKLPFFILLILSLPVIAQIKEGLWRGELILHDTISLPFNFSVKGNIATIHNGDERIHATITQKKDSAVITMPVFGTTITVLPDELLLSGEFFNSTRKDQNHISFRALYGDHFRFSDRPEVPKGDITGNWEATFDDEDDDNKTAVGIFKQEGARVTGTFLTATGDYRFLEGELSGNQLSLSAFDGSHAFLFTAELKNGELKNGHFFSGIHYHETWSAHRNDSVKLKDERSFTFLKPGYSKVEFSLPDLNGNQVTLNDPMFKGKAVIIQIMGSCCPNCMDETRFLSEWYNKEKPTDLIIVGIDYERITKEDYVKAAIKRLKDRFNIEYPILFGGTSDKEQAAKTLPMLNRILGYPTSIYIDKHGNVREIHTGFNGPATGELYEKFKIEFENLTNELRK